MNVFSKIISLNRTSINAHYLLYDLHAGLNMGIVQDDLEKY